MGARIVAGGREQLLAVGTSCPEHVPGVGRCIMAIGTGAGTVDMSGHEWT